MNIIDNRKDVLLFFRVIAELNPFVVVKDEIGYLNFIGNRFPYGRFDGVPNHC